MFAAVSALCPVETNLTYKALDQGGEKFQRHEFRPTVRDFTKYDRCVLDYVYFGEDGEPIHLFFVGATEIFGKHDVLASRKVINAGVGRWVFRLANWPKCTDPTNITRIWLGKDNTAGGEILVKGMTLLKPGESDLPPVKPTAAESARIAAFLRERSCRRERGFRRERDAFVSGSRAAGLIKDGIVFGIADSMSRVRPREGFDASAVSGAGAAAVSLARNEHEAVQIVAMPVRGDVSGLELACEGDTRGVEVSCAPMGYVRTKDQPSYAIAYERGGKRVCVAPGTGWWPDPILSYTNACAIARDDVQSFWVSARASADAPAGVRKLNLVFRVRPSGKRVISLPFEVTVRGFSVPRTAPYPILTAFNPRPGIRRFGKVKDDPEAPCNVWKRRRDEWGDFLADRYLMMDNIYTRSMPYLDQLKRMKAQGRLGAFSLGYFNPAFGDGVSWKGKHLEEFRRNVQAAKDAGIIDHAWFYGADEVPEKYIAAVDRAARLLHGEFPGVPVLTTAIDPAFGHAAGAVDAFCPTTEAFVRHADAVKSAKSAGKGVWWYFCNNPTAPWANMFVECPPVEARLLSGAMAARERPDGFLYYELAFWNSPRPIAGGPFTDWEPASIERYHADGSWVCCGPGGMPLSTQRFENFRDGLEDFAYVRLVEEKTGRKVEVPADVMRSMTDFTDSPENVRRWRDSLAEKLVNDRRSGNGCRSGRNNVEQKE